MVAEDLDNAEAVSSGSAVKEISRTRLAQYEVSARRRTADPASRRPHPARTHRDGTPVCVTTSQAAFDAFLRKLEGSIRAEKVREMAAIKQNSLDF